MIERSANDATPATAFVLNVPDNTAPGAGFGEDGSRATAMVAVDNAVAGEVIRALAPSNTSTWTAPPGGELNGVLVMSAGALAASAGWVAKLR